MMFDNKKVLIQASLAVLFNIFVRFIVNMQALFLKYKKVS